ncbi:MAG: hypothetical protein BWX53_00420 [Parcubacteria group bacterium ADurb.Bin016]|nr:MAG: hypothetical protein BWX53_00420 [Parcubacteria group bacterium ADurb.Bin016]
MITLQRQINFLRYEINEVNILSAVNLERLKFPTIFNSG